MGNSIPIKITNNTDKNLCIIIFPIIFGNSKRALPKQQFIIKRKTSELLLYYPKESLKKNYCITVVAWKVNDAINFSDFDKLPHFTKSCYNPNYQLGPEEYRFFADLIIN